MLLPECRSVHCQCFAGELALLERNPLAGMKAPSAPPKRKHILAESEIAQLLKTAKASACYALIFTALATSMRIGELLGLPWRDVRIWLLSLVEMRGLEPLTPCLQSRCSTS